MLWTAIFLCASLIVAGCGGSKKKPPTVATTSVATEASATATALPVVIDLASQLRTRGDLPIADPIDLAARYGKTIGRAARAKTFAGEANVGDKRDFTVLELTGGALANRTPPGVVTITATLLAKSAHAYFYIDDALGAETADVQAAADTFEATTWPTVTGVFGEPAIPGVDGDPRIIVLQADLGGAAGGYYNGDDEFLREVRPLSNEAEMVYMDRTLKPGGAAFDVVLAHELQHLIHAHAAVLEEAWVNEGLGEASSMLVGGAGSTIRTFAANPETQLNGWDRSSSSAHYGAGAAFMGYLASRFGGDPALGAIVREPRAGEAGVDAFLESAGAAQRFREVFADWIAANILNLGEGPYAPGREIEIRIDNELQAGDSVEGEAHQFGTDYYAMPGLDGGDYVLRFKGATNVAVLPEAALAEGPVWWGNAQDGVDTTLTYGVDLTSATDPRLSFRGWHDIERWFDWGYVSVSTDDGASWQALAGSSSSADDPMRQAFGAGYSGVSGGEEEAAWTDEAVSLAAFAGKKILLRFEYVTDGGTHGEGWAIRNVQIADGGSPMAMGEPMSDGWVNVDRGLAQTYAVRLITTAADGGSAVLDVPLDASGGGELRFNSAGLTDAVVAIAGTTEGTNQLAAYTIELARP